jgi:hypothetical protein
MYHSCSQPSHADESILLGGLGSWSFIIHYRTVSPVTCISMCILLVRCVWHTLILTGLWCWKWLIEPLLSLNTNLQAHKLLLWHLTSACCSFGWAAGVGGWYSRVSTRFLLPLWVDEPTQQPEPLGLWISAEKSRSCTGWPSHCDLSSVVLNADYYISVQKNLPPKIKPRFVIYREMKWYRQFSKVSVCNWSWSEVVQTVLQSLHL